MAESTAREGRCCRRLLTHDGQLGGGDVEGPQVRHRGYDEALLLLGGERDGVLTLQLDLQSAGKEASRRQDW